MQPNQLLMDILTDIIQRCHKRHKEKDKLRQRKTVFTPRLNQIHPYHYKVHCARRTSIILDQLESANISFMPIGHAPQNDHGPLNFGGERFTKRQGLRDWHNESLKTSWGIQVYTGIPSQQNDAPWHDIYITYQAICAAPNAIYNCVEALIRTTANPLLVLTKSGGLRFSFRITDYLHPHNDTDRNYIYKHSPTETNLQHRDIYLQIRGDKGYSRWDLRYEILLGNLLDPPVITKEIVFAPIDALREELHVPSQEPYLDTHPESSRPIPTSLGSENMNLAKSALLKRGFSYLQQENDFHYWIKNVNDDRGILLSLWEDREVVWVRAALPNTEFPTTATPITDVLNDTGITPTKLAHGLPVNDKILAVREDNLSPLAIKRPPPVLHFKDIPKNVEHSTTEKNAKLSDIFNRKAHILALVSHTFPWTDPEVESYIQQEIPVCINIADPTLIESEEKRYRKLNVASLMRWKARTYRWEQVKDIPIEERMTNPFLHGNVCEDPERCQAVEQKGGDSYETICLKCPVLKACQQRGYLSQLKPFHRATIQMSPNNQHFIHPRRGKALKNGLHNTDKNERIYILYQRTVDINNLFFERRIPKSLLEQWVENWNGHTLGNFAKALLNALKTESKSNDDGIGRVRSVFQAFKTQADDLIKQMCNINIRNLAGAISDSRPINYPISPIPQKAPADVIDSPMRLEEMITAGILDTKTVQNIEAFPTVCRDPKWTYWHELQHFFDHYKSDVDVPMRWSDTELLYWLPPIIHPAIKHLLLIGPTLSEEYLSKVFPTKKIDVVHTEPKPWLPENQVFQIRTDMSSVNALYTYDNIWNDIGASKIGERIFTGIRAEIDRDTNIKHIIITNGSIMRRLSDLKEKENVCDVLLFKSLHGCEVNLEEAQVVWLIGRPFWAQRTIWCSAQMLFGNDEVPLNYDVDINTGNFTDERIQSLYQQHIAALLTQIVGQLRLDRETGKKVVLLTDTPIPNVTDRKNTFLFDWEDFEIAGGLDTLHEVIATRECFEAEREKLTDKNSREDVVRVLGCSERHANRVLNGLRGGNIRVSLREQILFLLSTGEKRTAVFVAAIDKSPQSIANELKRLINTGEIVRVQRGIYALPD